MEKFYVTKKAEIKKSLSKKASEILNMKIQDFVKKYWIDGRIPKELKDEGEIYTLRYKVTRYGDEVWTGGKFEPEHRKAEYVEIRLETIYDLITLEDACEFLRIKNRANKPTKTSMGVGSKFKLNKILAPYGLKFGMKIEKEEG